MRPGPEDRRVVVSFGAAAAPWLAIGDAVMGGVSRGALAIGDGLGVFEGVVSLENGGGFASVRSPEGSFDLSGWDGLVARVRGDGKRYGLRLRTSAGLDGPSFQADLEPEAGAWREVALPFASFRPIFRGRPVAGQPPLDPAAVRSFGLIVGDRQAGPFRLEVQSIAAYRIRPR